MSSMEFETAELRLLEKGWQTWGMYQDMVGINSKGSVSRRSKQSSKSGLKTLIDDEGKE
jgi:hypothetical protein